MEYVDLLCIGWRISLVNRTQQVILDGCCSDILPVTSRVPQGTVLVPLLFLCYINDLPDLVSCCCRLYADDVLLYKVIRTDGDCISLQSDLDCRSGKMTV